MRRWPSAVLISLLAAARLAAMEADSSRADADTARTVLKREVVVTGSPLETTRDRSIHRIRLLDSNRIAAQQAVSLRDVLITELNVGVQQDAVLGGSTSIQGIGGNGVKILVDGVPVVGRLNGSVDIGQVLLANASQIEMVEGPMAVMYGSDAIGGVINVITRRPDAAAFRGSAHGYMESVGTYNLNLGVTGSVGNVGVNLVGGRNLFDGWTADPTAKRADQWKPREQYLADLRISPAWSTFAADYDLHVFDETILNRGEPRPPYGETAFDDEYRTQRIVNSITGRWRIADNLAAHGTAAFTHYRREKLSTIKNLVTLQVTPVAGSGEQDTTVLNTAMTRLVVNLGADTNELNATAGLEGTHENMESGRLVSPTNSMTDLAAFAELRWQAVPGLTLQVAGRGMWNSTFGPYAIPSLHSVWKPSTLTAIRASIARGFRAPGLRELYLYFVDINHDIVGNPDLSPEYSTAVNVSGSQMWAGTSHAIRLEPSAYFNDVRNMISLAQVEGTQQFSYVNIGRMVTAGAQADVTYSVDELDVTLGGVLAAVTASTDGTELSPTQWTPQAKLQLRWATPLLDLSLNSFLKYTGKSVRTVQTATSELATQTADAYTMMDVTLGRSFFDRLLSVSIGCKNVLNVTTINVSDQSSIHNTGTSQPVGMGRLFTFDINVNIQ